MTKKRIRHIFLTLLILCLLVVLPINLGLPQLALERTLVLAFGIDKIDDNYELSAQVMVPQSNQSGYTEKREVKAEKGKTIDQALARLQLKVGRKFALAHANVIVISDNAVGENIVDILDIFMRSRDIGNYVLVVSTPDSAKEVLSVASQEDAGSDMLLSVINFSHKYVYGSDTTIDEIMHGYYSPSKTSLMSRIELSSGESESLQSRETPNQAVSKSSSASDQAQGSGSGQSQTSLQSNSISSNKMQQTNELQQSIDTANETSSSSTTSGDASRDSGSGGGAIGGGASSAGQSQSQSKSELNNKGSIVVLKSGKIVKVLDALQYRGFHWLMPVKTTAYVELQGLNDENLTNATANIKIVDASDKLDYIMTNDNKPIIKFKTNLKFQITSTVQDDYDPLAYAEFANDGAKAIKSKLQALVDSEVQQALEMSKNEQIDIWNIYDKFHQKYGKRFLKYVENNEGDYMKDLKIYVEVISQEEKF